MIVDFEEKGARKGYKNRSQNISKYNEDYQQMNKVLNKKRSRNETSDNKKDQIE